MTEVRTRFAPSPTGFVHIGGVRSAFYSWLFARKNKGKFLLRIEDTDQERLVPGSIKAIFDAFSWFGIDVDEGPSAEELSKVGGIGEGAPGVGGPCGPYIQSLRVARYREIAEELIRRGAAYRCDCTPEMLERERNEQMARREPPGYSGYCRDRNVSADSKHVIRFKMPPRLSLTHKDGIKGNITWDSVSLRDMVLVKSDGIALYHLAVVVDDHDMRISHALRGEEWISTTPLHLLIYQALGWTPPIIGHLPVVLGTDGKKLSKRHGSNFVSNFAEEGYLSEALLNYVTLIGWSPGEGEEREIFSRNELVERFSLEHVSPSSGTFDYSKLQWMNGMYIRALTPQQLGEKVRPFVEKAGIRIREDRFAAILPHIQERLKVLTEAVPMIDFLFVDSIQRDMPAMLKKDIDAAKAKEILDKALTRIEALPDFTVQHLDETLRGLADELKLKPGPMFGVVRIAVTGKSVTPPLFESLVALGKADTVARIKEARQLLG